MQYKLLPITMTSNVLPTPFVADASSAYVTPARPAYLAFDSSNVSASQWLTNNTTTGWIRIDLGVPYVIGKYTIAASGEAGEYDRAPKTWTMQGSRDNSTWAIVDTQTNVAAFSTSEVKTFICTSVSSYRYYKLDITANQGDAGLLAIGQWEFYILVPNGFSGFSPWIFMKDMWDKHNKLWTPKGLILPKDLGFQI